VSIWFWILPVWLAVSIWFAAGWAALCDRNWSSIERVVVAFLWGPTIGVLGGGIVWFIEFIIVFANCHVSHSAVHNLF
jgi:hypothetical protein